jgi:hypothetical protein
MSDEGWKKYLSDYNEGLGLVYERFVLNDFLNSLVDRHAIRSVLEAPLYGMAGVSGINSVELARRGAAVTLVDSNRERLDGVRRIWRELGLPVQLHRVHDFAQLPFSDAAFDLAWEWAGLWYLEDAESLIRELVRTSRRLVFVAMPNRIQVGYLMRKYLIDREFFATVDERWVQIKEIKHVLRDAGVKIIEEGVLDVPPWPDTVMPAAELLERVGIKSQKLQGKFSGDEWVWSTMAYYTGDQPDLYDRVIKYAWLEHAPLPWQIKTVWAHHRYVLGEVEVPA